MWYCVDKTGFGWVFPEKPKRDLESECWVNFSALGSRSFRIRYDYLIEKFPKLTWEDEPVEIDISVTVK